MQEGNKKNVYYSATSTTTVVAIAELRCISNHCFSSDGRFQRLKLSDYLVEGWWPVVAAESVAAAAALIIINAHSGPGVKSLSEVVSVPIFAFLARNFIAIQNYIFTHS